MAAEIRWASASNRIYVTGPGSATLSQIKAAQDQAPLEQLANSVWHLRANLIVEEGAQLVLHGTGAGGDVDELRLQSNNSGNSNRFIFISADWGSISIQGTSISSWDDAVDGPDTESATNGRAYISVRSKLAADGVTALESRMDIINSEIGYLGYDDSEAYGLSWKVIGDQAGLLDKVDVLGDIQNSRIHHNYFGVYTFGGHGMQWLNNEVDHNVQYGFDPHDDSDHLLIQGNNVHHNGNHGIIASKRCDHITIRSNTSWANAQNGIMLHRSSDDCLIEQNQCYDNADTGIVLTGSARNTVRSNVLVRNFEAGIRLDLGSADNQIESNECASNTWHGLYLFKGSDEPEPGDDARPKRNQFINNVLRYNGKEAINLSDSDDNTFARNQCYSNAVKLRFERGFGNRLDGNEIPADVIVHTIGSPFDAAFTYITNQPAVRVQLDQYASTIFGDGSGRIFDPDEGNIATAVTSSGSTLILTAAQIGTTSTVVARNFWVGTTEGTALVNPTQWSEGGASIKQWVTQAASTGQSLSYSVGSLGPNGTYSVVKDGIPLASVDSDSSGKINFTDVAGTTNAVAYAIETGDTGSQSLVLERLADELIVSWTSGTLQRATSLSPPNWGDVSVTNEPFRARIKMSQPMEYFRVFQP